ncbi:hypothetical protein ACQ4PT_068918 [Festuca glaucescens]
MAQHTIYWLYVSQERRSGAAVATKPIKGSVLLAGNAGGSFRLRWPWGLVGVADHSPLQVGSFHSEFSLFFGVFFGMARRRQHPEVRIRSSLPYPRSGGASRAGGGHVESGAEPGFRYRGGETMMGSNQGSVSGYEVQNIIGYQGMFSGNIR